MSASRIKEKPKPRLWAWLTSIRLTVVLLLILAVLAVVGIILPQDQPPGFYLARFGETWGGLLYLGGFSRLYYSIWLLAPLTLLALNILACLVHGLPQALRRCFQPFTWETALTLPERAKISWRPGADPREPAAHILRRELGRARRQVLTNREILFLEKGRWRPLGPYLVHLALLFILAGGLIGKFWGVEGTLPVLQGETAQAFRSGRSKIPLDFQVRLDRFQVQYYTKGGTPKEFRSDLTFLRDGKEVARAVCRVNHPVTFGGLTFYQASYGSQPAGPVRLLVLHGDQKEILEVPERQLVDLPGGQGQVMALGVDGNFRGFGPAVQLAYKSGPQHPQIFMVLKDHPEMQPPTGPYRFAVESLPYQFYSVFQVKHDPGVWWVYAGFLLFLPGFYLAFLRPHQRWALVLEPTPQGDWKGRLLGASPRAREDFEVRQRRLCEELKKVTPS
jgi:cytochrome c biogenesis protein